MPEIEGIDRDMYVRADQSLLWLAENGALAGIAEVIAERRRQIELGWTPQIDCNLPNGWLPVMGQAKLLALLTDNMEGKIDYAKIEASLKSAAALCAAEIDRLKAATDGE
jgi:hypothetical protein